MDDRISLQLMLDATGHVTSYATVGGLTGATTYEGEIPAEFLTSTQPQAFKLIDNVLTKDPNYVAPITDVVQHQPSDEQRFQAQLALQMATIQKNQAEFNAQVLLQVADIKNASATPVTPESATPVAEVTTVTPAASSTMGFKCPQGEPGQIGLQGPKGDSVTPVTSEAPVTSAVDNNNVH
ncbi:DUF2977 domain-containing protein [Lactiplantibacillus plantarum]|uniref:DUF2977 domain-containing protein n=1 Tax=Lactiplantibacillus plantarum TaxID=1590 RepID=UPI00112A9CC9|nr:DUF2977 domain-containing protein [Lactiplantibacillus plantarum]TPV67383.1 DUF2977 domain-containing protein [Lactiplantibacillus plantarum]